MSLAPIAFSALQYEDFANQYIKAFEEGTTTPKAMATDITGVTTASKFQLNAQGFPVTAGSALVIPFIAGAYDLWIIPTAAEADANDTTNAIQIADNIVTFSAGKVSGQELTTASMSVSTNNTYIAGDIVDTSEFSTGNGGGGTYNVITGTGTANGMDIIAHNTESLSFVLVIDNGVVNIRKLGANNTIDNEAIIQRADTILATDGGFIYIPTGNFRYTVTPSLSEKVSIWGNDNRSSILTADNCDGLELDFNRVFGNTVIQGVYLQGINGTTRTGIVNPGTLDDADELFGVTIQDLLITDFNVGIAFRTVRNFTIDNVWIQDVNQGINLIGKNLVGFISKTKCTMAAGNGAGVKQGLTLNLFNYTAGVGNVPPEGIKVSECQFFGFDIGIDAEFCNSCEITNFDIAAKVKGIEFTTVQLGLQIGPGFIAMQTTTATQGIKGEGLATAISTAVKITDVNIMGDGTTTNCTGIEINDPGNTNQFNVNIEGGFIDVMDTYDILLNNPGNSTIENVRCLSSSITKSIKIGSVQTGQVIVQGCHCIDTIETEDADAIAGKTRTYNNIVSGTLFTSVDAIDWYEEGPWTPVDDSGDALVFTGVNGTYTKNGNQITARCALTYPVTGSGTLNVIGGLPYLLGSNEAGRQGFMTFTTAGTDMNPLPNASAKTLSFRVSPGGAQQANSVLSAGIFHFTCVYTIS